MDSLSDVIVCCRELSSEKTTERKKSLEKLKNLLNKKSVLSSLDHNTQHKYDRGNERSALTWDDIIREVHSFVYLETQLLQKGKEPQSATAKTNREKKKQEIGGVFKFVVRQAENRGPRLRATQLVKQITEVLRDDFMLSAYGLDYSSVLLKNVLSVRKYCSEIGVKTWHELITLFCKLFGDPECGLDKILLSRILHALISAAAVRCDLRPKKILAFFTEVFKEIRNEKRIAVIEHIISAANIFVFSIAQNSRAQVCKLGESICINMLYLWENKPSKMLKEEILVFLRTQMAAHHPGGARRDDGGSFAYDWDDWESLLRKLYELFYMDLQHQNTRTRFASSSKEINLLENYLELIVDICNQLFLENVSSIDVTQISTQPGPGTKKRRLESGWCYVLEFLSDREQHVQMIPWIQLVTQFLEKYPQNFPKEQVAPYLTTIANQIGDFKRVEVIQHLMLCAKSFIDAWNVHSGMSEHEEILKKISISALRCVSVYQADVSAYLLLTSMAQKDMVIEPEMWNLFLPSVSRPTNNAVQFLNTYLTRYKIPEHYRNHLTSLLARTSEGEVQNYPLRKQLMGWLFPERSQCLNLSAGLSSDRKANPWEIGHLVTLLLMKNQRDVPNYDCPECTRSNDTVFLDIEHLYLQTSNKFEIEKDESNVKSNNLCSFKGSVLCELYNTVLNLFKVETTVLNEVTDCDINHLESLSWYICMLGHFILWLVRYKLCPVAEATGEEWMKCIKTMVQKLGRNVKLLTSSENGSVSLRILTNLQRTFLSEDDFTTDEDYFVAVKLRSLMPSSILKEFENIVLEKNKAANGDISMAAGRSSAIHGAGDFDDFDMENSMQNDEDQDDFMDDGFADSQDSNVTDSHGKTLKFILDGSQFTEKQILNLEITRTLCFWCGVDSSEHKGKTHIEMDVDQSFIKSKLIKMLEKVESQKGFDLCLLKMIIKILTSSYQHVSEENLNSMITALRFVAKAQKHDQEICCLCLELLSDLVPHLKSEEEMVSPSITESREAALTLLSAYLNLPFEKCPELMRLEMAKCMVQFIKADPDQNWASVSTLSSTEKIPVAKEFVNYLGDLSHAVRMYSAKAVQGLFMCQGIPCDRITQDQCFDTVYSEIMELLNLQDNLSVERAIDERTNRVGSSLSTLVYIVCASPVCEKKALFAFCQLTKARNIETEKIRMILKKLAKVQGFESGSSYIQTYLPYLVHQWLCLQYNMDDFPFQMAFCDSRQDFYREHCEILITELMMFKDVDTAKRVVSTLNRDWVEVLKLCIPKILVFILPQFAASRSGETSNEQVKKRTAHATACYNLLSEQVTKEVVDKNIVSNLDAIVVNILLCLYDREEDEFIKTPIIRNLDPEPNPPCYNLYQTQSTLDYLTGNFPGNPSLGKVLSRTPDSIQKILEQLSLRLFTDHRLHEKRRLLLMYRLVCRLLLRDFDGGLGDGFVFILREMIHRLVYLLQDMRKQKEIKNEEMHVNNISCMALEMLHDILKKAVLVNAKEVENYLKFIINSLVPFTDLSPLLCEQVKNLLKMLILDNKRALKAAIALLDPFPDQEDFASFAAVYKEIRLAQGPTTLCQIITNYLSEDEKMLSMEHSKEGLHFLSHELASRTDEFSVIIDSERGKQGGLLSRLVMRLVKHSRLLQDSQALQAITQCLGILGPIDLMVLALPSPITKAGGNFCHLVRVVEQLDHYLIDQDMRTVQATSQVLKTMFSSPAGKELVNAMRASETTEILQSLHPFLPKTKSSMIIEEIPKTSFEEFTSAINKDDLWWDTAVSHDIWVIQLTSALLNSGAVKNPLLFYLRPLCNLRTKFCEFLLPLLIHDILGLNNGHYQEVLSRQISKFFLHHCCLSSSQLQGETSICLNKESIITMLEVINYLRQQTRPQQGRKPLTVWDNNFWLDVNYLHIAKAALYCSAHFTTVLYAEIWCNCHRQQQEETNKRSSTLYEEVTQSFTQDSQMDSLSSDSEGVTLNVQDLLLEAYRQIGDPDGVYGCGAGRLADPVSRIRMYEHEGQWEKAVITYDIGLQQHSSDQEVDLLKALDSFGSQHLLDNYLENYPKEKSGEIRNLIFKSAIKVGKWDLNIEESSSDKSCGFSEVLYRSLSSLKDSQFSLISSSLNIARMDAVERLRKASVESCRCLYPILSDLKCVSQIDQAANTFTNPESRSLEEILTGWTQDKLFSSEFEYVEPIYNIRCSILQVLPTQTDTVQMCMQKELLHLSRLAVQNKRHLVAERVISKLKSFETSDFNHQVEKLIEEANLFWIRGEQNIANHMMKKLLKMVEQNQESSMEATKLYPRLLSLFGNWLAETHSENPNVIMEDYLEKTVGLLESLEEQGEIILDAYLSLARFADGQYQHIVNYMKSSTFEAKQTLMLKAKKEMARIEQLGESEEELLRKDRYYRTLSKQSVIDQSELNAMEEDRDRFLNQSVHNYIKCLKLGDKHDIRIFRLISLWFSNPTSANITELIMMNIENIKSFKFLSLMYQLCARMDTKPPADQTPTLQKALTKIIYRTAVDHPHHALSCILALANAKRDFELLKKNTASKSRLSKNSQGSDSENEGRIEAAKNLLSQLKNDQHVGGLVKNMEILCDAYIQLANYNVSQYRNETKAINLDKRLWIMQLKEMDNVAVPTDNIPIDPSGDYKSIVTFKGFEPTFKLAGGINLPKIIKCFGSDGRGRRQLVKGQDDLRQDAIMQQVFEMLNTLLHKNPETRKRNLSVRQYKVIPLSQRSGVLEWCEGTLPMGMYLIGDKTESTGAHKRFRPQDLTALACRKKMAETTQRPLKDKLRNFLEICSKFQPVMRYFFMENFSQPSVWFERRLAYTKSVSTTSIVGYILGLGDRHVQNILIDTNSAELVHIDLGIAFEQGRILPTPETVPFRLTRDIIDGMGVCGVEGTFRRCCEKTMELMHTHQEAILTILEVLLYDPLNNWTISPQKAAALQSRRDRMDTETSELNATKDILMDIDNASTSGQQESQESVNKLAERVLLRLHQKLQGYEEGVQLSVASQVNNLIQEARDPKNLCKLFTGWQPYI